MSKIAVVGYARAASGRLPNKVLFDLGGKPAFVQNIERVTSVVKADYVFVACTRDARDDPIELLARLHGIECFRGSQEIQLRGLALAHELGLGEDDWWLEIHCDSPLMLTDWMPWAMEQADEHRCDWVFPNIPEGTLLAAIHTGRVDRWRCKRRSWLRTTVVEELQGASIEPGAFHFGAVKYLIVHFPADYLVPWPWGLLFLDYPVQAVVLKEIYRQLYKGAPIDAFDVCELFEREPHLAQMIPLSLPAAAQPVMPGGELSPFLESIRLNAECIEVTWQGGGQSVG